MRCLQFGLSLLLDLHSASRTLPFQIPVVVPYFYDILIMNEVFFLFILSIFEVIWKIRYRSRRIPAVVLYFDDIMALSD